MRRAWFAAAIVLIGAASLRPGVAQVRTIDVERLLGERFGFTPAEVAQARGGTSVAKTLPSRQAEDVGVFAAVRINAKAERLAYWFEQVESFRKAAELGLSRRLSDPPQVGDFADLALDPDDLAALRACRPGKCDLRLGGTAITRFQSEIDWAAPDAEKRASLLTRQLLLGHAQAYLKGGDQSLGAYHNETAPKAAADEFHQVLWQAKALYDMAPAFASYLERFPAANLPGSKQFLYWAKGGAGPESAITLHQLVIYHAPGGEVVVADKQLYASRYTDAALTVVFLASAPDGSGFYALAGGRARSTMLQGLAARTLRGRVEKSARETAAMYLDWIRGSLTM